MEYKPYTYLIGWTALNKWYYGVRYRKTKPHANPADLWNTYFTSSSRVADTRKIHGEPDVIQIRRIFDCPIKAKEWEYKVLMRMKAEFSDDWLNLATGKATFGTGINNPYRHKGPRKPVSDETKQKLSAAHKGKPTWNKGKTWKKVNIDPEIETKRKEKWYAAIANGKIGFPECDDAYRAKLSAGTKKYYANRTLEQKASHSESLKKAWAKRRASGTST
jgi:hypothetical protein